MNDQGDTQNPNSTIADVNQTSATSTDAQVSQALPSSLPVEAAPLTTPTVVPLPASPSTTPLTNPVTPQSAVGVSEDLVSAPVPEVPQIQNAGASGLLSTTPIANPVTPPPAAGLSESLMSMPSVEPKPDVQQNQTVITATPVPTIPLTIPVTPQPSNSVSAMTAVPAANTAPEVPQQQYAAAANSISAPIPAPIKSIEEVGALDNVTTQSSVQAAQQPTAGQPLPVSPASITSQPGIPGVPEDIKEVS